MSLGNTALLTVTVIKHRPEAIWVWKDLFGLLAHLQRKPKQKVKQAWEEFCLLACFLYLLSYLSFPALLHLLSIPVVGWVLLCECAQENEPSDMSSSQSGWVDFSVEVLSSQIRLSLAQVAKNEVAHIPTESFQSEKKKKKINWQWSIGAIDTAHTRAPIGAEVWEPFVLLIDSVHPLLCILFFMFRSYLAPNYWNAK